MPEETVLFIPQAFFLLIAALLGAVVGSFLNVVILRLPQEGGSIAFPASHCPKCKSPLEWYENIPIVSYLFLRGKCGHCGVHISIQYPLVECVMMLLSFALCAVFGFGIVFAGYFLFLAALLVIIVIDYYHFVIYDIIDLPGIVIGFLFSFINPLICWQDSLAGIIIGGGFFWLVAVLFKLIRKKEGMGGGDIKMLAMIGAWLGVWSLPFVIFFSALSGAIVGSIGLYLQRKKQGSQIPYGPFLSVAAIIYLYFSFTINDFIMMVVHGQWP